MLTSLVIQVQSPTAATLPASLGRAVQALFLSLLRERDAALATAIHEAEGPKPFTASNLVMSKRQNRQMVIPAGQEGWLRFTGLTAAVSQHLRALAADPPKRLNLADHTFTVTGATLDGAEHPWAGQISYQDLAAPFLLGESAASRHRISLEFATPTTFKSNGRYVPLPQPALVFGSLLDRWQAFAPIALPPEMRDFAAEAVVLSRYDLRTRGTPYKDGGMQIGFTGRATFVALERNRYWLNVLQLLAAFAFYSGIGYQTGAGLGQVKRVEQTKKGHSSSENGHQAGAPSNDEL